MDINDREKADNFTHAERLLGAARGADIVIMPEIWNVGYFSFQRYDPESEPLDGETVQFMSEMARRLNAYLLAGSWVIKKQGKLFNTSFFFDREGTVVRTYEKIHLFGYGSRESELLTRGQAPCTVTTELATFGVSTCYDLRFPELYRQMMRDGVEMFLVVSGWPYPRLEHWTMLNRVRAVENVAFLASANCVGINAGIRFCGHSMIVDPWGTIMASAGDEETILWADIDIQKVHQVRAEFPALDDIVLPI
jgi:predicted amidohydrolase